MLAKPRVKRLPAKLKLVVAPIIEELPIEPNKTKSLRVAFEKNLVPALILVAAAIMSVAYFNYATNEASARVESAFSIMAFKKPTIIGLISSADRYTKKFTFLAASSTQPIVLSVSNLQNERAVVRQFFTDYGKYFGLKSFTTELKLLKSQTDELGITHLRYHQMYKGVPVFGVQMLAHIKSNLSVESVSGKFLPTVSLDIKPKIVQSHVKIFAEQIAKNKFNFSNAIFDKIKLFVFNESVFNAKAPDKNYLVWQVQAVDKKMMDRKILYINAKTGELVHYFDGQKSATYRLIYHCNSGSDLANCLVGEDDTLKTGRMEGEPLSGIAEVDDLYRDIGYAQGYFQNTHNLDGANGIGGTGNADFGSAPTTTGVLSYYVFPATSSTTCPNSVWNGYLLKFCQGTVSAAIVGHEYQHSVSDFTFASADDLGLIYENQSGQIEEGFADIFGLSVERYGTGTTSWKMIFPVVGLLRNIANPPSTSPTRSYPDRFYHPTYYCGADDHGGVHRNSTVISHIFYNFVNGADFNGCLIGKVNQDKAEKIFYRAMKQHMNVAESFNQLYDHLNASCGELYGDPSFECRQLRSAMQAAEINQPGPCSGVARIKPACDMPRLGESFNTNLNPLDNLPSNSINVNLPDSVNQPGIIIPINTNPNPTNDEVVSSSPANLSVPSAVSQPVVEQEVRTPSFSVVVIQNGNDATVTGKIDYYGKGANCSGPRPYDPVIVRWGDASEQPSVTNGAFNAKHTYFIKNKTYTLTVSVYNSCYGMKTESQTITTAF